MTDSIYREEKCKVGDAILAINPEAEFAIGNNSVDDIMWKEGTSEISKADIVAKMTELDQAYIDEKYQRDRYYAYPQLREQLDKLYHDIDAGKLDKTGEWFKAVKKVKDDNPKPSE